MKSAQPGNKDQGIEMTACKEENIVLCLYRFIRLCAASLLRAPVITAARSHKAAESVFSGTEARKAETARRAEHYFDEYGNMVLRLAYSYVHNMADAEDILQETLIKVLEAEPSFENAAHEKAYILRAAANASKNHLSRSRLHQTDELSEELAAEDRADLSFVWEAVKSLPETAGAVLHLYYYEGCKTAEIAQILGRSESTVRSDLKRGRERLREMLKEEYDFE